MVDGNGEKIAMWLPSFSHSQSTSNTNQKGGAAMQRGSMVSKNTDGKMGDSYGNGMGGPGNFNDEH